MTREDRAMQVMGEKIDQFRLRGMSREECWDRLGLVIATQSMLAFADAEATAMRERAAAYVEGKDDTISGSCVFAALVSGNNQPCMSSDPRDRLHSHNRRRFDSATAELAAAIRALPVFD